MKNLSGTLRLRRKERSRLAALDADLALIRRIPAGQARIVVSSGILDAEADLVSGSALVSRIELHLIHLLTIAGIPVTQPRLAMGELSASRLNSCIAKENHPKLSTRILRLGR